MPVIFGGNALKAGLIAGALITVGCQSLLQPAPEKLSAWTTALRDQQPADAYAAVYKIRDKHLVFVAAKHTTSTDSLTFKVIEDAYSVFDFDVVIVEGFPNSRGPNPDRLVKWVSGKRDADHFQEGGEAVPTIRGALAEGSTLWGGEPDDSDIRDRVLRQGFSPQDLLGFYTLRSVPQWIRELKIENGSDTRVRSLIEDELEENRLRLGFSPSVLPGYSEWASWYSGINGKEFGADFDLEETGPLVDGAHGSNNIGAAISRARASFLHELIVQYLNTGSAVLVVFGASHLLIHQPALNQAIGDPCYVGPELDEARDVCVGKFTQRAGYLFSW